MELKIRSVAFAGRHCRTRIPFRFGKVTLVEAPLLTARVVIEVDGREWSGHSADLAIPKWFAKNPQSRPAEDWEQLFASARRAATAFRGAAGTPFGIWREADTRCTQGQLASGIALVDGFGVALLERALIDAACRAAQLSFRHALEQDLFGFDPGALLPETAGLTGAGLLAARPPDRVVVRHTVGGVDVLRASEVAAELRGRDDHPVALEEDIRRYGLRAFKLKVGGDPAADFHRLIKISHVLAEHVPITPLITLDGNEQYEDLAQLARLIDRLASDPDGRRLVEGLAYIEQPLPRARTFDPTTADDVHALGQTAPLLIDEADDSIDAFSRAWEIGYRGVSVKNCKGIFRALANRALCLVRGGDAFQTSEDLTNLPVLSLQQDLTLVAALGLPHSERNGHHFFPGLDVVPPAEAEAALLAHPDLYERRGERIVLRICDGEMSLACQHATGFGYALAIDWDGRLPLDRLAGEASA